MYSPLPKVTGFFWSRQNFFFYPSEFTPNKTLPILLKMPPNSTRREYSTEIKERIIGMCLAGSKQVTIAETLGVPKSSVNDIWQRYLKKGNTENTPRPGRPPLTTERDERQLVNIIKKDRRASLADITSQWNADVSMSTTRRVLHDLRLNSRKARKKPFLNENHIAQASMGYRAQRLEFGGVQKGSLDR